MTQLLPDSNFQKLCLCFLPALQKKHKNIKNKTSVPSVSPCFLLLEASGPLNHQSHIFILSPPDHEDKIFP